MTLLLLFAAPELAFIAAVVLAYTVMLPMKRRAL